MARPQSNRGVFVAVVPPPSVASSFLSLLANETLPPHRRLAPEQVHMTVHFIGDVAAKALNAALESVERSAAGLPAFDLRPGVLSSLPREGPARHVALLTDAPAALLELQTRLARRFARRTRAKPHDRFEPRFSLCRFLAPSAGFTLERAVEAPPFRVDRLEVLRTVLRPDGTSYPLLASFSLGT